MKEACEEEFNGQIEDNEEEIGPIDDDDQNDQLNEDLHELKIIDDGSPQMGGDYFDGDEPEDDSSQEAND